jgi:hypothetical protein
VAGVLLARRLTALAVALLVLVEGAGVARALGGAESIQCCCGRHDAHRACKCKACPVSKKRARGVNTRVDAADGCDGHDEPGALVVLALPLAPPGLPSLLRSIDRPFARARRLFGRATDVGRPPP